MTKAELVKRIESLESEGKFHEHAVIPNYDKMDLVTPEYDYFRKGISKKIGTFFVKILLKILQFFVVIYCKLQVKGKENLKGIKGAVVTSNHINNIDCLLNMWALNERKLRITVGEFNNPKGLLGAMLRAGGTLPIASNIKAMKNFYGAVNFYLQNDYKVIFYQEGSLWWCYEKPRPAIDGAYRFAVENNVPVVPIFFTFKNLKMRKDGTYKKKFIMNIGKPIYPDTTLPKKEAIKKLCDEDYAYRKDLYEGFYGKELKFNTNM